MKKIKALWVASLLAVVGFSGVASAHDYSGSLGASASATDRWYFVCAGSTGSLTYQIQRTAGTAAHVKAKFDSTGIISGPTTGPAAVTAFSSLKTATTASGTKFFTINKTAAGAVGYRVRVHCVDTSGTHNPDDQPTAPTYVQNQ
jgi:hypothetical protein